MAALVRMMRMDRFACWEREVMMEGIFIVATLPLAARRRCAFLSWMLSEALNWAASDLFNCFDFCSIITMVVKTVRALSFKKWLWPQPQAW